MDRAARNLTIYLQPAARDNRGAVVSRIFALAMAGLVGLGLLLQTVPPRAVSRLERAPAHRVTFRLPVAAEPALRPVPELTRETIVPRTGPGPTRNGRRTTSACGL